MAGFISAERIEAGTISTNKLAPNVGSTLVISGNPSITNINNAVAPAFDPTVAYEKDDLVMYQGVMYTFTTDHPAGAWNPNHVTRTNVASQIELLPDMIIAYVGEKGYGKTFRSDTDPALDPDNNVTSGDYWLQNYSVTEQGVVKSYTRLYNRTPLNTWQLLDDSADIAHAFSRITQTERAITTEVERATAADDTFTEKTQFLQTSGQIQLSAFTADVGKKIVTEKAGITLDSSGKIVIEALSESVQGTVNKAAKIDVDSNGKILISALEQDAGNAIDKAANIEVNSSGKILIEALEQDAQGAIDKAANISVDSSGRILLESLDNAVVSDTELTQTLNSYATIEMLPGSISQIAWDYLGNESKILLTPTQVKITTAGTFELDSQYFDVSATGEITATKGTIGGWTIAPNKLTTSFTDPQTHVTTNEYVGMANGTDTTGVVFWAGGDNPTTAPFHVGNTGWLESTSGRIGGWTIDVNKLTASYYDDQTQTTIDNYVGVAKGDPIDTQGVVFWAGGSNPTTAPFHVGNTGWMYSTSGRIGGWNIGNNKLTASYTPAGQSEIDNYVGVANGSDTSDIVFWSGDGTPTNAPFRVKRDGEVVLTKLKVQNDDGTYSIVDLTNKNNSDYWKLNYSTVKSYTLDANNYVATLELSGGTTLNFKHAAPVKLKGSWDGGAWTVQEDPTGSTGPVTLNLGAQISSVQYNQHNHNYDITAYAFADRATRGDPATTTTGTQAFEDGVAVGEGKFSLASVVTSGASETVFIEAESGGYDYYKADETVQYREPGTNQVRGRGDPVTAYESASDGTSYYQSKSSTDYRNPGSGTIYARGDKVTAYESANDGTDYYQAKSSTDYRNPGSGTKYDRGDQVTAYESANDGTDYYQAKSSTAYRNPGSGTKYDRGDQVTAYESANDGTSYYQAKSSTAYRNPGSGTIYARGDSVTAYESANDGTSYYQPKTSTAYRNPGSGTIYARGDSVTAYESASDGTSYYQSKSSTAYRNPGSGTVYARGDSVTAYESASDGTLYYQSAGTTKYDRGDTYTVTKREVTLQGGTVTVTPIDDNSGIRLGSSAVYYNKGTALSPRTNMYWLGARNTGRLIGQLYTAISGRTTFHDLNGNQYVGKVFNVNDQITQLYTSGTSITYYNESELLHPTYTVYIPVDESSGNYMIGTSVTAYPQVSSGGTIYYKAKSAVTYRKAGSGATYYDVGSNYTCYKGDGGSFTPINSSKSIKVGAAATFYRGNGGTYVPQGTQATLSLIDTSKTIKVGAAATFYRGNGGTYVPQGTQATLSLVDTTKEIKVGAAKTFYRGNGGTYVPQGSQATLSLIDASKTIKVGAAHTFYRGNGGTFTPQGSQATINLIDTSKSIKVGAAHTFYRGNGGTFTPQGSQATINLIDTSKSIKVGAAHTFYRGNGGTFTPQGSQATVNLIDTSKEIKVGAAHTFYRGNGGLITEQGSPVDVTPIKENSKKHLLQTTRFKAGHTITDTYYTKNS